MGKRIILTTFGSFGDVHPFLAISLELKRRGHDPVIATSAYYKAAIEECRIGFHAVRPDLAPGNKEVISSLAVFPACTGRSHRP